MVALSVFACLAQEPQVFTTRLPQTGGYVMTDAVIAGKPLRFMVDSGASVIGVDPGATKVELDLEPMSVALGDDTATLRKGRVKNWSLGGISRVTDEVVVVDLGMANRYFGLKVGGIIGWRALGFKHVTLDYDKGLLMASDEATPGGYAHAMPVKWRPETPHVEAAFGPHTVSMLIDTGLSGAFNLPADIYDDLVKSGLIVEKQKQHGRTGSLVQVRAARSGFFTGGEFMHRSLAGHGVTRIEGGKGHVGQNWMVFFNCRFTTGYASGKLEYTPRQDPVLPLNVDLTLGAVLIYDNGQVLVEKLRPDAAGPMQKAGLKAGDRILSLGDLQEAGINDDSLRTWLPAQAGKQVRCVSVSGNEAPVTRVLQIGSLVTFHQHGSEEMARLQAGDDK